VTLKLYRPGALGWVYWKWLRRSSLRVCDEAISEVYGEFLGERVPCGGLDCYGTNHVNGEGEGEEEREFDDKLCASREHDHVRYDQLLAERNDAGVEYGFYDSYYDDDRDCA